MHVRKTFCSIMVMFIWSGISLGQVGVKTFSVEHGLPHSSVNCITEDKLGYLWIGTGGGLARFDGQNFVNLFPQHAVGHEQIHTLLFDKHQTLWITTDRGVFSYNGISITKSIKDFSARNVQNYLHGDSVIFILNDGDRGFISDGKFTQFAERHPIANYSTFHRLNDSVLVASSAGQLVSTLILPGRYQRISSKDHFAIKKIFLFDHDTLLSTDLGIYKIQRGEAIKSDQSIPNVLYYDTPRRLFVIDDQEGVSGLTTLPGSKDPALFSISKIFMRCAMNDSQGDLWIGSAGKGLFKIYNYSFQNLDPTNEVVLAIFKDNDGRTWVSSAKGGLRRYHDGKLERQYLGLDFSFIPVIRKDRDGHIWIGGEKGLCRYNEKADSFEKKYSQIEGVLSFDFDRNNSILVSTIKRELYLLRNDTVNQVVLGEFYCKQIHFDAQQNRFLLASTQGIKEFIDGRLRTFALDTVDINSITFSDSVIIAGSKNYGVYFIGNEKNWRATTEHGLLANRVYFVAANKNSVWVGTSKGLNRIRLTKRSLISIDAYTSENGLHANETNLNAYSIDENQVVVGLISGAYQLVDTAIYSNNPLHFSSLRLLNSAKVDGLLNEFNSLRCATEGDVRVSADFNKLTFTIAKINLRFPSAQNYQVKLQGIDETWSSPSHRTDFDYTNLPPDDYHLKIRSTDATGKIIFQEYTWNFSLAPSWYQTVLFKIAVLIFALILLVSISRIVNKRKIARALRLEQLKAANEKQTRDEIARDFHDQLGNQAARLINYIGLLRMKNEIREDIFENLSSYGQTLLWGAKDFIWVLDPANDSVRKLTIHLKDFGERMFSEKNIDFRYYDFLTQDLPLPGKISRQIILILKEAMTNAFKHSEARAVEFGVSTSDGIIELYFLDNGRGFNSQLLENSNNGLFNMRHRANKVNAQLEISTGSTGTTISLYFSTRV